MALLHDPIDLRFLGGRWVQTLAVIRWWGPYPATLPPAFVSDAGTIPSPTWPIVGHPLSARLLICYLLHDYELQQGLAWEECTRRLNARLRAVGCDPVRRVAIVSAVTMRGWQRRLAA